MARAATIHPLVVRITHWLNVVALYIMVASGLRIYNASPIFDFSFPEWITIGGWLEGARQWHFFAMWIFAVNGLVWVSYNVLSRHGRRTTLLRPEDIRGILPMIKYYLRIEKRHPVTGKYNALQKAAYTSTIAIGLLALTTGIGIYWPVQFQFFTRLFGGYDAARIWHFIAMAAILMFFLGHLIMVAIAGWGNFLGIVTGKAHGTNVRAPGPIQQDGASG